MDKKAKKKKAGQTAVGVGAGVFAAIVTLLLVMFLGPTEKSAVDQAPATAETSSAAEPTPH